MADSDFGCAVVHPPGGGRGVRGIDVRTTCSQSVTVERNPPMMTRSYFHGNERADIVRADGNPSGFRYEQSSSM